MYSRRLINCLGGLNTGLNTTTNSVGNITTTGGNVGIGTNTPSSLLHVNGTLTTSIITTGNIATNNATVSNLIISGAFSAGSATATIGTVIATNVSAQNFTFTTASAGSATATIGTVITTSASAQNLTFTTLSAGSATATIGTLVATNLSSDNLTFTTVSAASATATIGALRSTAITTGTLVVNGNTTTLRIFASLGSNTIGSLFTTGGNVGINTTAPNATLHVVDTTNGSSIQLGNNTTGDTRFIMYTTASRGGHVGLQSISAEGTTYGNILLNSSGGNVGIGISPSYKLDVSGTANFNGIIYQNTYPTWNVLGTSGSFDMSYIGNNVFVGNTTGSTSTGQYNNTALFAVAPGSYGPINIFYDLSADTNFQKVDGNTSLQYIGTSIVNASFSLNLYITTGTSSSIRFKAVKVSNSVESTLITETTVPNSASVTLTTGSFILKTGDKIQLYGEQNFQYLVGSGYLAPNGVQYTLDPKVPTSLTVYGNLNAANVNTVGSIFTTGGNVGIGTTNPTRSLQVSGDAGANNLFIGNAIGFGGQTTFDLNHLLQGPNFVTAQARCPSWNTYSSRKLKEDIRPIENAVDLIKKLEGVKFKWRRGQGDNIEGYNLPPKEQVGFIVEDVYEILPSVCSIDNNQEPNGMDYAKIVPVCVNAIKELVNELQTTKNDLSILKTFIKQKFPNEI